MCGIVGYICNYQLDNDLICKKMTEALFRRGPDDTGNWIDNKLGVVLGHRRLSIQDLSDKGRQPMISQSDRFVVIFNGEIYNFKVLRKKLENKGVFFKTNSDTEVLLEHFEHFGLEQSLNAFSGMFAFAIWDKKEKKLILARDRFGEKPLYYSIQNNNFFFASELKSLKKHPIWKGIISKKSLSYYTSLNYIPAPLSIYENTFKLLPGSYLTINYDKIDSPLIKKYWNFSYSFYNKDSNDSDESYIEKFIDLFSLRINEKLISDVPVGCFLSGGIDSTIVATLTQEQLNNKLDTFSVGFESKHYDESRYSNAIAKIIKTNHHEIIMKDKDARDVIPKLPEIYDEPFSDSSQIPMFLISNFASQHVKVALSGDGGDELFGGYNRYIFGNKILSQITNYPYLNKFFLKIIYTLSEQKWDNYSYLIRFLSKELKHKTGEKLYKLAKYMSVNNSKDLYFKFITNNSFDANYIINESNEDMYKDFQNKFNFQDNNFLNNMTFNDINNYLPDDILTKVDRAAMYNSLETRVPFLDLEIFNFAKNLPENLKIRNGKGKWILRKVLEKYIPEELINRPKMGFSVPIHDWLRGPLKDILGDLITKNKISNYDHYNYDKVQKIFNEHINKKNNWHFELWNILVFQLWHESNLN